MKKRLFLIQGISFLIMGLIFLLSGFSSITGFAVFEDVGINAGLLKWIGIWFLAAGVLVLMVGGGLEEILVSPEKRKLSLLKKIKTKQLIDRLIAKGVQPKQAMSVITRYFDRFLINKYINEPSLAISHLNQELKDDLEAMKKNTQERYPLLDKEKIKKILEYQLILEADEEIRNGYRSRFKTDDGKTIGIEEAEKRRIFDSRDYERFRRRAAAQIVNNNKKIKNKRWEIVYASKSGPATDPAYKGYRSQMVFFADKNKKIKINIKGKEYEGTIADLYSQGLLSRKKLKQLPEIRSGKLGFSAHVIADEDPIIIKSERDYKINPSAKFAHIHWEFNNYKP